jgi:colanic acid biosynthesis glycosyl transferase WcaI
VDVAFTLKDFSSGQVKRLAHWLEAVVLSRFDRVSSISNRMVGRLAAKGVVATRAVFFPNWVDTLQIRPLSNNTTLRQELGIQKGQVVALYSGNMGLKQGLNILAETCQKFRLRDDIQFLFCGDGPYRETLVRMTQASNNVKFLPLQPLDKLNELLNTADMHLLPQLAGAEDLVMPSKLTGMMASGRPVVGTARSGTELHSTLQGRGFATDPGDVESFASAISRLAADPDLRRVMGSAARKYAVERLGRDEILKKFELSLLDACGHTPSGAQQEPIHSDDPVGVRA